MTQTRHTASCGCEYVGRFDYTERCAVIDRETWTGLEIMKHGTKNRKALGFTKKGPRSPWVAPV